MVKSQDLRLLGTIVTLIAIWPISAKVEQCGASLRGEGVLQSHGFPRSYPNDYSCDWTFQAGPEDTVTLTFTHFEVEDSSGCRYDYLQIFAMGRSPKYCGSGVQKVAPGGILTAKGPVKLVFKSDDSETMKGFRLSYRITPPEPETDEVISCDTDPCKNGADCVDVEAGEVACFCLEGFTGEFCEINIDDCASDPCQNGGTCIDEVDGFSCNCPEGFLGATCGVDVDDCVAQPCRNGGTCIDGANSFECQCVTGYTGWNCGQDIDECASGPCLNMGVCEDRIGFYECVCFPGYTGVNCEIPPTTAAPSEPQTTPATLPPPSSRRDEPEEQDPSGPLRSDEPPLQPAVAPEERDDEPVVPSPNIQPSQPEPDNSVENPISEPTDAAESSDWPDDPVGYDPSSSPPTLHQPTTIAAETEDPVYPNSTIENAAPDTAGGDVSTDKGGQSSNTALVIGVVVGVLGAIAVVSIAAQYWISKNKTKIQPANIQTVPPNEPDIEKEDEENEVEKEVRTEQNDIEDNNKLDLVEEDLTGRRKLRNPELTSGKAALMDSHTPRKKTKKRFSLAKKLKSLTKSKSKNPAVTETEKSSNSGTPAAIFEKNPQTDAVPEHIKVLRELNANLDRVLKTSRTPYGRSARSKRSIAAKRLMTTMVKQQQNAPVGYPSYNMAPLGNPFLGQNNLLLSQSINPPNSYVPASPICHGANPFNPSLSKPEPTFQPTQITPPALAIPSQKPISPFFETPTRAVSFTRNTTIPTTRTSVLSVPRSPMSPFPERHIAAVPFTSNATSSIPNESILPNVNLNPESSDQPHKSKKKPKKHKRHKKKHKTLDEEYNATTTQSAHQPLQIPSNLTSPTPHNIESLEAPKHYRPFEVHNSPIAPNINGMNTLPARTPTARRRSVMSIPPISNIREMQMAAAFPAEANVNTPARNFPAGYSDMENIAESHFFSRTPNFSVPDSPPNPFGNVSTRSRPHRYPYPLDTDESGLSRLQNPTDGDTIYDQTDHMARTISPSSQHRFLSAQNSNATDQSMSHPVNIPSFSPVLDGSSPFSEAQNPSCMPGYSFWQ